MKRTVICHFFNEEWLLPWWCRHHKEIFDHGIIIDYHSTDRSCEIIKEICPTWQVVSSRNSNFEWHAVDTEVAGYEKTITGWRLALNATEFLIGNYQHLTNVTAPTNIYLDQFVFVDTLQDNEPRILDPNVPLHQQRKWGYGTDTKLPAEVTPRSVRSMHNHPYKYPAGGRHIWKERPTYNDLAIFYYGWASLQEESMLRKLQIQTKLPLSDQKKKRGPGTHHNITREEIVDRYSRERLLCKNLTTQVVRLSAKHERTKKQ